MGDVNEDLAKAASLPPGDVIRILLEQHARIRQLFDQASVASGDTKVELFHELRALLAVHETAEEVVLRPVSRECAGPDVADARNDEEKAANELLAALEELDVNSPEFDEQLASFQQSVDQHAELEEHEEFETIVREVDQEKRRMLGDRLRLVENLAPTYPHPGTAGSLPKTLAAAPFATIVDRVKDALAAH